METIVELRNVKKVYQMGEVQVHALRGVNLKVNKGDLIAIIGPSGSGKSTLLNMIGCLDKPTSGKVIIRGTDVSEMSENELARIRGKEIGFVFQFFHLVPTLTALENVELPMMFQGVSRKKRREKAKYLLKLVGLGKRMLHRPSQLSGGERQRVAIARALANDPALLLADEPTGNLDSKSGKEIIELIAKLNKEGRTIIIVTHDISIAKYTRKIIHIKDGLIEKEEDNNEAKI